MSTRAWPSCAADGYTGAALQEALDRANEGLPYLVEGWIFEHFPHLWYAADGVGKSILGIQCAAQIAAGEPVFGVFPPSRSPLRVVYAVTERHESEPLSRLARMKPFIPGFNVNNFALVNLQGQSIETSAQRTACTDRILRVTESADVLFIDPIYPLVRRLSTDEGAAMFTLWENQVTVALGHGVRIASVCSHHSNRGARNEAGERVDEDFYGSRLLRAQFVAAYHIKRTDEGSVFTAEKDSHSGLPSKLALGFDEYSGISTAESTGHHSARAMQWLAHNAGREFTMAELKAAAGWESNSFPYRFLGKLGSLVQKVRKGPSNKTFFVYTP